MRKEDKSRIADALGASRVVELGSKTVGALKCSRFARSSISVCARVVVVLRTQHGP